MACSESLGLGWDVPACFVVPTPRAQWRGWSRYSGRSIVAQDVFSQFWAGFGMVPSFFRPADPPRSVLGHGLGNRAAQLHRTVCFSCSFLFRPADTPSRGRGHSG